MASSLKVIVIDDMVTIRKMIRNSLNQLGVQKIDEAHNGEVAMHRILESLVERKPYQLIISDLNMPKMTGIELLKQVRGMPELKTIPFIVVSAENEKQKMMAAQQLGITAYLYKPFTKENLQEKVQGILENLNRGMELSF